MPIDDGASENKLTPVQRRILEMLDAYVWRFGRPPAYREIVALVPGVTSTSQVGPHLERLTELGYLNHQGGIARGAARARREIPIKGRIAAGEPLEIWDEGAWRTLEIELPRISPTIRSELYALQVKGDSMIEDGILDGDWLIVREGNTADNGAIVVATHLDAGQHGAATVKRIYKTDTHVRLQPANAAYMPREIEAEAWQHDDEPLWEIQGTVIATYRRY